MYRSVRSMTVAATVASALAFAPAALAGGGVTPDNRADRTGPAGLTLAPAGSITPDNRADRTGPAGLAVASPETNGVGLIHASMVNAEIAARAATASTDTGFEWADAGIGAAAGIAAALAGAGIATGVRNRRRIAA